MHILVVPASLLIHNLELARLQAVPLLRPDPREEAPSQEEDTLWAATTWIALSFLIPKPLSMQVRNAPATVPALSHCYGLQKKKLPPFAI